MAVVVKGWAIPEGCLRCPFYKIAGCLATGRVFPDEANLATRQSDCPLEETDQK